MRMICLSLLLAVMASVGLCEDDAPKFPTDLSYVEEISAEDIAYIVRKANKECENTSHRIPFSDTLFLDGLKVIDEPVANNLGTFKGGKIILGVALISEAALESLLSLASPDDVPSENLQEEGPRSEQDRIAEVLAENLLKGYGLTAGDSGPLIKELIFTRLENLSVDNIRILRMWRGEKLTIPEETKIPEEGLKNLKTKFHTWKLQRLPIKKIQERYLDVKMTTEEFEQYLESEMEKSAKRFSDKFYDIMH